MYCDRLFWMTVGLTLRSIYELERHKQLYSQIIACHKAKQSLRCLETSTTKVISQARYGGTLMVPSPLAHSPL